LGAPVLHTLNGKCALPSSHALAAGMPWTRATSDLSNMHECFSPLFREADGLLAVGCRFTQASTGSWLLKPPPVAQIDIAAEAIGGLSRGQAGVCSDAGRAREGLLMLLPRETRPPWAGPRPKGEPWRLPGLELLGPLRRALPPDAIVAADVTRLAYILMAEF